MTDPSFTRKRKQELMEQKPLSAWSDFVYSSPSSPGQDNSMNLDSFLQNNNNESNNEQLDSRRHSVAVGEMNFHSFDSIKQELDMGPWETDLQNLLGGGASIPSSWSSNSSSSTMEGMQQQPALHRRAMSLRLETTQPFDMHHTSVSMASPTTPAFFSSSFLDALKTEDDTMGDLGLAFTTDASNISASSPLGDGNDNTFQDLMMNHSNENTSIHSDMNTITPSAISNDVNTLTQWFLNQPLEEQVQLSKPIKASSPPTSPSNTSSMSTSPSPPITPMQPISTAVCDTMLFQQQHPSIPEEDEESEAKENWEAKTRKHNAINMRMIQGVKNAPTMKPLIQQYLLSSDPSSLGEHKVMILTSKVAQKSYGTEKRFVQL
jgi:hypothetical protein